MTTTKTYSKAPGAAGAYLKAFGGSLPGLGRLPFLPGGGSEGGRVPDLVLEIPQLRTDPAHLA